MTSAYEQVLDRQHFCTPRYRIHNWLSLEFKLISGSVLHRPHIHIFTSPDIASISGYHLSSYFPLGQSWTDIISVTLNITSIYGYRWNQAFLGLFNTPVTEMVCIFMPNSHTWCMLNSMLKSTFNTLPAVSTTMWTELLHCLKCLKCSTLCMQYTCWISYVVKLINHLTKKLEYVVNSWAVSVKKVPTFCNVSILA